MTTNARVFRSKRKCQLRQEIHGSIVNSLPSEITIEILSRLPTDSILQCRLVCKPWRNLLRHPSFAHLHLHHLSRMNGNNRSCHGSVTGAKVCFGLLFSFEFPPKNNYELYYGESDEHSDTKLRKINQPPIVSHAMIGSCNGLICFLDLDIDRMTVYEPSYVSNPITREYMTFPKLEIVGENKIDSMVCGFGYHPSINRFKIVKIYYIKNQPLGRVQVYTLGGGCDGWRDVGEIAYSLRLPSTTNWHGSRSAFGVLANGALHWLDSEHKIVSFDLAEEKSYLLPSPPLVYAANVTNCFQLKVLGGCLCFVHLKKDQFLDIWFLRKKGESSSCDVNEQEYDLLNWIKEFSMPIVSDSASPIALTENGELLLSYRSDLCCYDPKTAALEKLMEHGWYSYRHVVPHVNSFVSLKALGEKCRSRKSYKANPSPREFIIKKRRNA